MACAEDDVATGKGPRTSVLLLVDAANAQSAGPIAVKPLVQVRVRIRPPPKRSDRNRSLPPEESPLRLKRLQNMDAVMRCRHVPTIARWICLPFPNGAGDRVETVWRLYGDRAVRADKDQRFISEMAKSMKRSGAKVCHHKPLPLPLPAPAGLLGGFLRRATMCSPGHRWAAWTTLPHDGRALRAPTDHEPLRIPSAGRQKGVHSCHSQLFPLASPCRWASF